MTDQQSLYTAAQPTWNGSDEQQQLAERIYQLMVMQGAFFPQNVPIRQSLENLAAFIAEQDKRDAAAVRDQLDAALQANDHVFQRSAEDDERVIYATTRMGFYTEPHIDTVHTFKQRLYEPENPLPIDDLDVIITRTRPALTTVEPVYISDYWQQRAPVAPDEEGGSVPALAATPVEHEAEEEVAAEPEVAEPVGTIQASVTSSVTEEHNATTITLPSGVNVDLAQPAETIFVEYGTALAEAIQQAIADDPLRRIVAFGDEYYPEDAVVSLSKGDLRRIREYILEQGEPMPDTSILSDVYYKTPRDHDFATFRFALNYRLNREKDFEFVGVPGMRLWSAKGLPAVGTKRLKTSELGQFYAFLEEDASYDDSLSEISADEIRSNRQLSRFLTFFEWEYGVLPYDAAMKALLPPPLLSDQRTSILRIEAPQHYTVYLVELRYPTTNRGGWLHGLEDFFKEYLVPGALITLSATDDPSVWTIQYGETGGEDGKLLQQDDKKGRYSFANHTFYCDVDSDLVPSQERLPRLKNMKVLPPGERRRITSTAGYVLEQIGQSRPGDINGFELGLRDLFMGVNVQRPATRAYLQATLNEDENFLVEDETFIYFPPTEELPPAEDDDTEE